MNSKKQEVLKSDRMKELKQCHGIINDRWVHPVKNFCRKLFSDWQQN